jgi:hypothetical protein
VGGPSGRGAMVGQSGRTWLGHAGWDQQVRAWHENHSQPVKSPASPQEISLSKRRELLDVRKCSVRVAIMCMHKPEWARAALLSRLVRTASPRLSTNEIS